MEVELGGKRTKRGVPLEDVENLLAAENPSTPTNATTVPATNLSNYQNFAISSVKTYGLYILGCVVILLQIIILFRVSQLDSSTTESVNSLNSDVKTLRVALTAESNIYNSRIVNDTLVANIHASALQISQPSKYSVSEVVVNQKRVWSAPLMKVYIDDTITWNWSTNENIISSDSNYVPTPNNGKRVLDSGPLKSYATYSHTFSQAGLYYYTSENSQTLTGIVIVLEKDILLTNNVGAGAVSNFVSKGFLKDVSPNYFNSLDGCWEECFDAPENDLNLQTPWNSCSGDWIFVGAKATQNGLISGAFAKADIFSRSLAELQQGYSTTLHPIVENGLNWYSIISRQPFNFAYGVFEYSSPNYGNFYIDSDYIYCSNGINVLSFGSRRMCVKGVTSTYPATWRRKLFTNTCPLIVPPY